MFKHHHLFHWGRSRDINVSAWAAETEQGAPDGMALLFNTGSASITTRVDIAEIDDLIDVLSRARADAVAAQGEVSA